MPELLRPEDILASLRALAEELGAGTHQHVVVMVGGAVMALHGMRLATADVDSARQLDEDLLTAARRVAEQRELPRNWLNAGAQPWRPQTLRNEDCDVAFEHPRLLVLAAPLREVFLMKLASTRLRDQDDLPALWLHAGFVSPEQAVAHLYEHAYPDLDPDPYLAGWLAGILGGSAPEV